MLMMGKNKVVIILSGKRKCGKDFVADKIVEKIGKDHCIIIRVSSPIKKHFCEKYGLDFQKMASSSENKEKIRQEMILWGEEQRNKNSSVFCRAVVEEACQSEKEVWILSDARRPSDITFFKNYTSERGIKCVCVRISANEDTRKLRNWKFTPGVDDAESECALDDFNDWDFLLANSNSDNIEENIHVLCTFVAQ